MSDSEEKKMLIVWRGFHLIITTRWDFPIPRPFTQILNKIPRGLNIERTEEAARLLLQKHIENVISVKMLVSKPISRRDDFGPVFLEESIIPEEVWNDQKTSRQKSGRLD